MKAPSAAVTDAAPFGKTFAQGRMINRPNPSGSLTTRVWLHRTLPCDHVFAWPPWAFVPCWSGLFIFNHDFVASRAKKAVFVKLSGCRTLMHIFLSGLQRFRRALPASSWPSAARIMSGSLIHALTEWPDTDLLFYDGCVSSAHMDSRTLLVLPA